MLRGLDTEEHVTSNYSPQRLITAEASELLCRYRQRPYHSISKWDRHLAATAHTRCAENKCFAIDSYSNVLIGPGVNRTCFLLYSASVFLITQVQRLEQTSGTKAHH